MLLRLLLIASALTTLSLVNTAFVSTASSPTGSDTLNPIASCAPTPTESEDEDDEKDTPRPGRNGRAFEV